MPLRYLKVITHQANDDNFVKCSKKERKKKHNFSPSRNHQDRRKSTCAAENLRRNHQEKGKRKRVLAPQKTRVAGSSASSVPYRPPGDCHVMPYARGGQLLLWKSARGVYRVCEGSARLARSLALQDRFVWLVWLVCFVGKLCVVEAVGRVFFFFLSSGPGRCVGVGGFIIFLIF